MWQLNLEKIIPFFSGQSVSTAVETGTCRGNGTRALAKHFSRVITIELSEALHLAAKEKLARPEFAHVEFLSGGSAEVLARLLPTLPSAEPVFFFLDAHWSGDATVDWGKSEWKGYGVDTAHLGTDRHPRPPEQCPLVDELKVIVDYFSGTAFVLIDDMKNLPAEGAGLKNTSFEGEDWSHLSRDSLLAVAGARLKNHVLLENPSQWLLELSCLPPR